MLTLMLGNLLNLQLVLFCFSLKLGSVHLKRLPDSFTGYASFRGLPELYAPPFPLL